MDSPDRTLYRYRFDEVEYDEARVALHVGGQRIDLEQRPLQVLALLLQHVDEVVPRAELFDQVWAGRPTVDNVLANAVAKLRKALGERAAARVVNVPKVGYRLCGPVERIVAGRRASAPFKLEAGQTVPGREHFILRECLDPAAGGSVWLVRHDKTGEQRVYKFASDGERIDGLKREVTIHRLLRESLGDRDDLVRIVDWNFDDAPAWLQSGYAGRDLSRWAREDPAFAGATREQRIAWFLQIAGAVAAAHGAGVLHKDLKPSNVLVAPHGDGWQFRVADFGSGRLLEPGKLEELGITRMGMTVTSALPTDSGVTLLYLAPEVLAGAAPSIQSDVYALGLILFQMIMGDFRRTLAPGWRQGVEDELLCEDISAATNGDPGHRLPGVEALVQRLLSRDARAIERQRLRDSDMRALAAERLLERSRARRPWLIAAIVLLALGLVASLWQTRRVRAAKAEAQQQAALAQATNRFLNEDLLGAGMGGTSPAWYERNPTLREVLDAAAQRLDVRFASDPLARTILHQTLGRAYKSTGDYKKAVVQLQAVADGWKQVAGSSDPRAVLAQYELAPVLAHLSRFKESEALLDQADKAAGARRDAVSEIALRAHLSHGDVALQRMQIKDALAEYQAAERLGALLHPADAAMSAHILLAIADCALRSGNAKQAEAAARRILAGGPYTQETIGLAAIATARLRLASAMRAQDRFKEAIPIVQQALAEFEISEGADSQSAITALGGLAYLYSWTGDDAKALSLQRDLYQRSAERWGAGSQAALIQLLNLGSDEYEANDLSSSLQHLQQAEVGLVKVSGSHSPMVQAARVSMAMTLSDLKRNQEALDLLGTVDPVAYQATTSDPGRALVLRGLQASLEVRLHHPGAETRLLDVIAAMQAAHMDKEEIATFQKELPQAGRR